MNVENLSVEDLITDEPPRLPSGLYERMMRAQTALELISLMSHQVASLGGIHADHIAAVAGYASEDMDGVLTAIVADLDA